MTDKLRKNLIFRGLPGILLYLFIIVSSGFAGDLDIDGYLKNFTIIYEFPDFRLDESSIDPPPVGAVSNRLRLNTRWHISRWLTASAAYDFEPRVQDQALYVVESITNTVGRNYRIDDFRRRLYPDKNYPVSSFALYHNLDRLQLDIRIGALDISLGRQAIAWGSARVINPTDIFTPFSYEALDTEDRAGIDAIRARLPAGFMSELDAGFVAGEDFKLKNSAGYLRYKTNLVETDLSAIMIGFREHLLLGFDMTRAIGGAGSWIEIAYVWPKLLQPDDDIRPDGYWRISTGADYSMGANSYGFMEYHYNQPGGSDPDQYLTQIFSMPYIDGTVYLMGEHYLIPGFSHQISPLVSTTGELLCNLSDGSVYLAHSLEYNVAENVYLAAGLFIGIGPGPKRPDRLESEFGAYPDTFYSSFRLYF